MTQYTTIFNAVTAQLAALAKTTPTGAPLTTQDAMALALPTGGNKFSSQQDIQALGASLIKSLTEAIAALANAGTADTALVTDELAQAKIAIVDAIGTTLK